MASSSAGVSATSLRFPHDVTGINACGRGPRVHAGRSHLRLDGSGVQWRVGQGMRMRARLLSESGLLDLGAEGVNSFDFLLRGHGLCGAPRRDWAL